MSRLKYWLMDDEFPGAYKVHVLRKVSTEKTTGRDVGLLSGSHRQGWVRIGLIGVWLVILAPVALGITRGDYHPVALATAALIAYAILYARVFWMAFGNPEKSRQIGFAVSMLAFITLATSIGFGGDWLLLFIFLAPAFAVALPQRQAVAAVFIVTAVLGVLALMDQSMGIGQTINQLFGPLFGGLLTVFIKRTRNLIRELRDTREELARAAVAEERLRFSRDLHDLLGHTLSLVVVKSEAVRRLAERGEAGPAAREAADIEAVGRQALVEVREAVTGYRGRGLTTELDNARSALADTGIEVTVRQSGTPMPPEADALLGWAVRESVTNVIRHSDANRCEIDVRRCREGQAILEIRDDGVGPNGETSGGSGLRGLAERTYSVGGTLVSGPRPGGGYRLTVTLPLADRESEGS